MKGLALAGIKCKVHVLCFRRICILIENFSFDLHAISNPRNGIVVTKFSKNDKYEFIYMENGELAAMKGSYPPFVAENDFAISANEIIIYLPGFLSNNPYYQNANLLL
jgi:hypothetical protein